MKPTFIGFDSKNEYAVVIWHWTGGLRKTICFNESELQITIARYHNPNDMYYQTPYEVRYFNKQAIPA